MLPSGNTDLSQTQGWIKSLFILQSHILKNHTDIFSFLTVIPIIVKHNKYHSPHQMQLGSSQQCWLPRVCPVWSVEDVMSLVTNGNWIVAYVMKFVLRHAQPLLLWSRTVPLRDNDCTGQFPGVPHVCEGVGMKQRGAQLAPVFLGGGVVWASAWTWLANICSCQTVKTTSPSFNFKDLVRRCCQMSQTQTCLKH